MSGKVGSIDAGVIIEQLSELVYGKGNLVDYLGEISTGVSRILGIDWSVVTLTEDGIHDRILASSIEITEPPDKLYSLHGTVTDTVVRSGEPLLVNDAREHPECGTVPKGFAAYIGVPLRTSSGNTIGTICSFHRVPRAFSKEELHIARVYADRAASAIENYQAYERLTELNDGLEQTIAERTNELRNTQDQLVLQERLAAIGEFASMIVHEIRSPLSTIGMALDYLSGSELEDRAAKRVKLAASETSRLRELLDEILLYAGAGNQKKALVDLNQLVEEVLDSLKLTSPDTFRQVVPSISSTALTVSSDPDKLRQVVINLLNNACEASPADARVGITTQACESENAATLLVSNRLREPVQDVSVFTRPFFTTKQHGTGLGLAIVKSIVEANGGRISFDVRGTEAVDVVVNLPRTG